MSITISGYLVPNLTWPKVKNKKLPSTPPPPPPPPHQLISINLKRRGGGGGDCDFQGNRRNFKNCLPKQRFRIISFSSCISMSIEKIINCNDLKIIINKIISISSAAAHQPQSKTRLCDIFFLSKRWILCLVTGLVH